MNLEHVQIFIEVTREGSFAGVARHRGTSPSSVSRSVAGLEEGLGIRLFHRTTRRLSLTEAGESYREQVLPLVEELERAASLARDLVLKPQGELRVTVAPAFAQLHLSRWLPDFLQRYPLVDVHLLTTARYVDLVSDRIDVAIRLGRADIPNAVARPLCAMPRVVVASPEVAASIDSSRPEVLAEQDCLVFPFDGFAQKWKFRDGRGSVQQVSPRPRLVSSDGPLLRELALSGAGFTLLPRWLCGEDLARGDLVDAFPNFDVTGTEFDARVLLLFQSRKYLPLKARVFIDYLVDKFRDGPPWEPVLR